VKLRVRRIGLLVFLLIGLIAPGLDRVNAQGTETESGVSGNSYTSPTYGYSLTWDTPWEVSGELSEDGFDQLQLSNSVSSVYFEGYAYTGDEAQCLADAIESLSTETGVSDYTQSQSESGPLEGEDTFGTWAVYDLTYTADDGTETAYSEFIICRTVVPGESVLQITQIVGSADYNDELDGFATLVDSVVLSGGESTGTPVPSETETPGELSDLEKFVELAAEDVDSYWTREFPVLSGGKEYVSPADWITYDDQLTTPCGDVQAGKIDEGDGPFFCPPDDSIYLDMQFAQDQFDKYGLFPVAEALAHEIGHHVQQLLGIETCEMSPCLDPSQVTSQELEVMADCFAGAWSQDMEARGRLGNFDIEANLVQYAVAFGDPYSGPGDPGAHGRGALRIYWFLTGYYYGSESCLLASPATTPSTEEPAPTEEASPDEPKDEPTISPEATEGSDGPTEDAETPTAESQEPVTFQLNESAQAGSFTIAATGTDRGGEIEQLQPDGEWLIVYVTVTNDGDSAAPFDYAEWNLVDSADESYAPSPQATDALVSTVVENGINEDLEPGESYDLAIVFDVPATASGISLATNDGSVVIELDQ
jgi:predicted metalloprotease